MFKQLWSLILIALWFWPYTALAFEMTSSSFKVRDPDINIGGQQDAASGSFQLKGTTGQEVIGQSSSSSFTIRSGFQYYDEAQTGTLIVSGFGAPDALVVILDAGSTVASTLVLSDGTFSKSVQLAAGTHNIDTYQVDNAGRRSTTLGFIINVTAGATQTISNIFFSPTIDRTASEVFQGDTVRVFGRSQPSAAITITVQSHTMGHQVNADNAGNWFRDYSGELEVGDHNSFSKSQKDTLQSVNSPTVTFKVKSRIPCDANFDGRVNLTDFSIMLFYWDQAHTGPSDCNRDGVVNLTDFSILLFNWTG